MIGMCIEDDSTHIRLLRRIARGGDEPGEAIPLAFFMPWIFPFFDSSFLLKTPPPWGWPTKPSPLPSLTLDEEEGRPATSLYKMACFCYYFLLLSRQRE